MSAGLHFSGQRPAPCGNLCDISGVRKLLVSLLPFHLPDILQSALKGVMFTVYFSVFGETWVEELDAGAH